MELVAKKRVSLPLTYCLYLQEGDRLTDEDLYRFLGEMRRPAAAINKKFKIIPGHLKMDIQQPAENLSCCLTSNLFEVNKAKFAVTIIRYMYMYCCSFGLNRIYSPCAYMPCVH